MADSLEGNTTLTCLGLFHNNIGNEGAQLLANSLERNTTLTMLSLGGNNIGAKGAQALASALEGNTKHHSYTHGVVMEQN